MAILKADILTFVNDALHRKETDIDKQLRVVVDDVAKLCALEGYDDSQGLTATSLSLNYPADALDVHGAIISASVDTTSEKGKPLITLPGGWRQYQRLVSGNVDALRSTPTHKLCRNRKIYLYPPPGGDYTTRISYYRRHGDSLDTLEFSDDWDTCLKFGAVAEVAAKYGLEKSFGLWYPRFEKEAEKRRIEMPHDVAIVETHL